MSDPIERIDVRGDEPAVTHRGLLPFVEAARAQPTPRLRIDANAVTAAWFERRAQRRRTLVMAAAAGFGALAIATLIGRGTTDDTKRAPSVAVDSRDTDESGKHVDDVSPSERISPDAPVVEPTLAAAVRVAPTQPEATPDYAVTGAYSLALREGGLRLEVTTAAEEPLEVTLPEGSLQITTGVTIVEVAGHAVTVTVESGVAVRIDADGKRHTLRPKHAKSVPVASSASATTASQLAALAEERLAVGDRATAIKHLAQLVRRYPSSAPARTGLIDLARLLKATGRNDEARCAYRLWLDKNPRGALRSEVERAVDGLGEGKGCRGLTPRH